MRLARIRTESFSSCESNNVFGRGENYREKRTIFSLPHIKQASKRDRKGTVKNFYNNLSFVYLKA